MTQHPGADVRVSELMAAISLATDIGMAQPLETGLAVCMVATGLAGRLALSAAVRQRTYQLSLLQHIGCTAAATQVASVMGDEMVMRAHAAMLDFADAGQMFRFLLAHVGRTNPPLHRPAALARAVAGGKRMTGTMVDVCEAAEAFLAGPDAALSPLEAEASLWDAVISAEPVPSRLAEPPGIDRALRAVADLVDLKSPFLAGHSSGVAELAAAAAGQMGLDSQEVITIRRAGWLHDLGRIGVSSSVWGHPGPLTAHRQEQVRLHSCYTGRVLDRTPFLRGLGALASAHHERLDGSGYVRGARGGQLGPAARVLAAADAYHAMTEQRPYRGPLSPQAAAKELRAEADGGRLDGAAVEAVLTAAGQPVARRRPRAAAGLTPREVEILRQLVRGLSIRQIARELSIAPKTVDGHIQRIYSKTGVSTRAGAALFALSHDLVPGGRENGENSP
ncbi:MAG TPA: HD domain-containing phosphohydrolase [Streptosporangiaceae bacterium]|nr:HD domain-containing phosphohydrolase [Streptosporangiaceae bacterium]